MRTVITNDEVRNWIEKKTKHTWMTNPIECFFVIVASTSKSCVRRRIDFFVITSHRLKRTTSSILRSVLLLSVISFFYHCKAHKFQTIKRATIQKEKQLPPAKIYKRQQLFTFTFTHIYIYLFTSSWTSHSHP